MKKENYPSWLVPSDIAKELKGIGFEGGVLSEDLTLTTKTQLSGDLGYCTFNLSDFEEGEVPTWEQVFEWFRNKGFYAYIKKKSIPDRYIFYIEYGLTIYSKENLRDEMLPKTYEEARKQLVEKLIELCKDENK